MSKLIDEMKKNKKLSDLIIKDVVKDEWLSTNVMSVNLLFSGKIRGGIKKGKIFSKIVKLPLPRLIACRFAKRIRPCTAIIVIIGSAKQKMARASHPPCLYTSQNIRSPNH